MEHGSNTRVVVLFPGALGDLVLAMPTLVRLRARHAGAPVTLVVSGWLQPLVATSGLADATASLDDADVAGLFGGERVPSWMRGRPLVYAWLGARDPAVRRRLDALASRLELASVVRADGPEHAARAYARQVGTGDPEPFAWPSMPSTERIARLLATLRRPTLAMHAGAGSPAKRWAQDGFRDVAARWLAAGGDVVEILGPAERGRSPIAVARAADWPLADLVALLARVDAYVGNDSGVTHLAAAAGAAGVAVYGPTAAHRWAPFGGRVLAIQAEGPCRDSGIPVTAVTPERVGRALETMLANAPPHRSYLDKVRSRE